MQKFKMAAKNGGKMIYGKCHQLTLLTPLRVKNFDEIVLSHTVSEINAFICFMQKFKMAAKKLWEKDFLEKVASQLWGYPSDQNFNEIALSHIIPDINAFLRFKQKFKMAAK